MADRYWVGGTASWDGTAGTKWATTSGGAGGAAVPTSADNVFFDAASGAVTVTVAATANCLDLTFTGFTGTFAGSSTVNIYGSLTAAAGMTWTHTGTLLFSSTSGSFTVTTAGKTVGPVTFGNTSSTSTWTLGDALNCSGFAVTVTYGTFTTNNFNVTASSLSSSNSNTRTINLGSSTVTLSTDVLFNTQTNLTFNAGTSTIIATSNSVNIQVENGVTFYNYTRSNTAQSGLFTINGSNTFNNLTVAAPASSVIANIALGGDQTINGTLTFSVAANASIRRFVRSSVMGTTRTLTCATVASLHDIDFRDITIAGAAAPVSGTRLGDCKGNSGITFAAGANKYWNLAAGGNWSANGWATLSGGAVAANNFPLVQDTCYFEATGLNSGSTITINSGYNNGTIDMSARTSNTMTLATGTTTPQIYGNWITGTGVTLTGTGVLTFAGRGSQTITSAGKTFTQPFTINTPGGSVTLQDAFSTSISSAVAFVVTSGTFDAATYNVTLSGAVSAVSSNSSNTRTIIVGSGTWSLQGSGIPWNTTLPTNLTITGTGTISLTSSSAKTFAGGNIQTYPTLNQGGAGNLTVTGSNTFQGLTNTAIGRIQFTGGTTNTFTSFVINGTLGNLLQLGSTTTTAVTLKKTGAWNVGANSTDGGNNTGLSFTAGDMDYLSISYVTGQVLAITTVTSNFLMFF